MNDGWVALGIGALSIIGSFLVAWLTSRSNKDVAKVTADAAQYERATAIYDEMIGHLRQDGENNRQRIAELERLVRDLQQDANQNHTRMREQDERIQHQEELIQGQARTIQQLRERVTSGEIDIP